jgi:secreted trypsin-like serine protease
MANSVCQSHLNSIGIETTLDSTQICAGVPYQEDSCQGDSGGALFTLDSGHFTLGGLVSYGGPCDGYGVYTNVYPYLSQIESIINSSG